MNNRELLEWAAKAINFDLDAYSKRLKDDWIGFWNPLTNDGDALRLAVLLDMRISPCCARIPSGQTIIEDDEGDEFEATRRAIVRAAAEIGKGMK